MRAAVIFALAASAAFAVMAVSSLSLGAAHSLNEPVRHTEPSAVKGLTVDDVPPIGQCRIWYDTLASEKEPARMPCEHALWVARRWGGRVIRNDDDGVREIASYPGVNDFTGVPAEALPHPGYCRAWLPDHAVADQPGESDCREARRTAREGHGRVLFMPL
ncbi:MAG: hypothetical protein ABUL73_01670 [Alphaproteobacteria bacterium]